MIVEIMAGQRERRLARERAVGVVRRRRGGRQMVEQSVILVEGLKEDRAAPHVGIGGQRIEHARGEFGALDRGRGRRMLGPLLGRQHPRHRGQRAVLRVLGELLERVMRHAALIDGRAWLGVAKAFERQPAVHCPGPIVIGVLIDAPVDARGFEHFGDRRPFERIAGIGVTGFGQRALDPAAEVIGFGLVVAAIGAGGGDLGIEVGTGPEDDAVGISARGDRAMIGVANGEGLGERELERNILAPVIAHRIVGLIFGPQAELALIPRRLCVGEAVRGARHLQRVGARGVEVKRRQFARAIVLEPDILAIGQRDRMAIAKAAYALHRPEIMVERTVFLHQDDDVAHILDRTRRALCRDGQRAADARVERRGRSGDTGGFQEMSSRLAHSNYSGLKRKMCVTATPDARGTRSGRAPG